MSKSYKQFQNFKPTNKKYLSKNVPINVSDKKIILNDCCAILF